MAAHEIEIILSRQWSDYLSIPVFITDPEGNLIYFNEPAEEILGKRFEDTGKMAMSEWGAVFSPVDADGKELAVDDLPLVRTLRTKKPAQGSFTISSLEGGTRHTISVVSFPITGMSEGHLGAIAIFWINTEA